jgi:hypothetical protein
MKFLSHLEGFIFNRIRIIRDIFTLFKLEAELASLNLYPLLVNLLILLVFLFSSWSLIVVSLAYLILQLTEQIWTTIGILSLLHAILLIVAGKLLSKRVQQISFKNTRALLARDSYELKEKSTKISQQNGSKNSKRAN